MGNNGKWKVKPIKADVQLEILKDRLTSGANKIVNLFYDVPSRRFYDSIESLDHKYKWDKHNYGDTLMPYFDYDEFNKEKELFG